MDVTTPTWSFSVPDEGAAFPEHLIEAVRSWLQWGGSATTCSEFARPRSKDQLRILITCAFHASLRTHHVRRNRDMEISVLEDAHFIERDVVRITDLAPSLAAVDGAVVLRRDWKLIGFGAEITETGPWSDDEEVE